MSERGRLPKLIKCSEGRKLPASIPVPWDKLAHCSLQFLCSAEVANWGQHQAARAGGWWGAEQSAAFLCPVLGSYPLSCSFRGVLLERWAVTSSYGLLSPSPFTNTAVLSAVQTSSCDLLMESEPDEWNWVSQAETRIGFVCSFWADFRAKRWVGCPTGDRSDCEAHTDLYQIHTRQMAAEELLWVGNCNRTCEVKELLLHTPSWNSHACLFFKDCSLKSGFSSRSFCWL